MEQVFPDDGPGRLVQVSTEAVDSWSFAAFQAQDGSVEILQCHLGCQFPVVSSAYLRETTEEEAELVRTLCPLTPKKASVETSSKTPDLRQG